MFHHPGRQIRVMVHGDDYAAAGPRIQLTWMSKGHERIFGQCYVKTDMLSSHVEDAQDITILNRIIRMTKEGIEMEADVRHAEIIAKELVHDQHRSVVTPGLDFEGAVDEYPELSAEHAQSYRKFVTRANYISIDRPDIHLLSKHSAE